MYKQGLASVFWVCGPSLMLYVFVFFEVEVQYGPVECIVLRGG